MSVASNFRFGRCGLLVGPEPENRRWYFSNELSYFPHGVGDPDVVQVGRRPLMLDLSGAIYETEVDRLSSEAERRDPILLESEMIKDKFPTGRAYVSVSALPIFQGRGVSKYRRFQMSLVVKADGNPDKTKRCQKIIRQVYANDWDNTGTLNVPLPVGATHISETIDLYRDTSDGIIPVVTSPTQSIIHYRVTEEDLFKGRVEVTRAFTGDIMRSGLSNGLIKFSSRHGLANPGQITVDAYDTTAAAWTAFGTLSVYFQSSGGTAEALDDKTPTVETIWDGEFKDLETIVFTWPSSATTTNNYKPTLLITLQYGRPYGLLQLHNYGSLISSASIYFNVTRTDLRYYDRAGAEVDAQASAYGTTTTAGDSDTTHASYLADDSSPSTTTYSCGFFRDKLVNCDHMATDAGDYWSMIGETFDTLSIDRAFRAPLLWCFAQYGASTDTVPATLANEALLYMRVGEELLKVG